jgi:hypothetical protein
MPSVVNTASAFAITELTGQERAVVLVDRALPYRPFELTTKQRVEFTWYPGNPEATATILGACEDPTTITGYWKDKYLSQEVGANVAGVAGTITNVLTPITVNDARVDTARDAIALFDSIVREGQLLEVTWDNQTRHGHLTTFRKKWQNTHDVEWEMEFQWISRGEPTQPAVVTQETGVGDTSDLLSQQNQKLQNDSVFRFAIAQQRQAQVITVLSAVNTIVQSAQGTNTSLNQQASPPSDATRRMVSLCNSVQADSEALIAALSETPWFAINTAAPIASLTFADRIVADTYVRTLIDDANALRRTAIEYKAKALSEIDVRLLGIYTARRGDDLRGVSEQFYGTPFEWQRLMVYNNLNTPQLVEGALILVPRLTTVDATV